MDARTFIRRNGSTILTVMGGVGVVATAVTTAKVSTKASKVLELAREEKGEELTTLEKIGVTLPSYIPAILIGTGTLACIFGANILNKRHQAALTTAYTLLNETYREYKNKVDELYGEGSSQEIEEAIFEDKHNETDKTQLFYDVYSDRYFESTLFKVQQAEYFLNRDLVMREYAYLNEWYEGLDIDTVTKGYDLGWSVSSCLELYWQPWLDFNHKHTITDDGRECIEISFWQEPIDNFEDYC